MSSLAGRLTPRLRSGPEACQIAGWFALQAKFLRQNAEKRGWKVWRPWLKGLRGRGHGNVRRDFELDDKLSAFENWSRMEILPRLGMSSLRRRKELELILGLFINKKISN
jgi:hypothetical protein